MIEFKAWPKTPRLFRDMVITEKIDGTNAAVHIVPYSDCPSWLPEPKMPVLVDGMWYAVGAQSRKRLISPEDDNFGFANWVWMHAEGLVEALGAGTHYGEWWGSGIQRGYGLEKGDKRFSLFNVSRYDTQLELWRVPGLGVVPKLYEGPFETDYVRHILDDLDEQGSKAAPGFDQPEGLVVFHAAANSVFKVLIENDDIPKELVAA